MWYVVGDNVFFFFPVRTIDEKGSDMEPKGIRNFADIDLSLVCDWLDAYRRRRRGRRSHTKEKGKKEKRMKRVGGGGSGGLDRKGGVT